MPSKILNTSKGAKVPIVGFAHSIAFAPSLKVTSIPSSPSHDLCHRTAYVSKSGWNKAICKSCIYVWLTSTLTIIELIVPRSGTERVVVTGSPYWLFPAPSGIARFKFSFELNSVHCKDVQLFFRTTSEY